MIKQRILTNIIQSRQFFPGLSPDDQALLGKAPSLCEKLVLGDRLDFTQRTYILFSGKVKIAPNSRPLEIGAPGRFDHERVVGILTQQEERSLDGEGAEVLEDSVVVSFPHEILLRLQQQYESVDSAWTGLWGRRHAEIKRRLAARA